MGKEIIQGLVMMVALNLNHKNSLLTFLPYFFIECIRIRHSLVQKLYFRRVIFEDCWLCWLPKSSQGPYRARSHIFSMPWAF